MTEQKEIFKTISEGMLEFVSTVQGAHQLANRPELTHVDPEILQDIRRQGYKLLEKVTVVAFLITLLEDQQYKEDEFLHSLFRKYAIDMINSDKALWRLCTSTIETFAPALLENLDAPSRPRAKR